jgi:hypothetical protein
MGVLDDASELNAPARVAWVGGDAAREHDPVSDPFDLLRDQLATAAEAQPHGARRRLRRPLWIAAAAVVPPRPRVRR